LVGIGLCALLKAEIITSIKERYVFASVCWFVCLQDYSKSYEINEKILGEVDFLTRNNRLDFKLIRTWIKEFGFTFFNIAKVIATELTAMENQTITGHDTLQSGMPLPTRAHQEMRYPNV